jgi:hypothetical protein
MGEDAPLAEPSATSKKEAAIIRDLTLRLLFVDAEAARLDFEVRRYRFRVWLMIVVTILALVSGIYGLALLMVDDIYGFVFLYPAGLVGLLATIGWVLLAKDLKHWIKQREEFYELAYGYQRKP